MTLTLDHVIVCLSDLDAETRRFEEDHGVASVEGGRHHGHGTANRIIPLGSSYVELLTVVDVEEASSSPFGSWALRQIDVANGGAVSLRTDALDAHCNRLGLEQEAMSRRTAEGAELRWRLAGLAEALPRYLPFFIEWEIDPHQHPGAIPVSHPAGDMALAAVTISGDHVDELQQWAPEAHGLEYDTADRRGVSFRIVPRNQGL